MTETERLATALGDRYAIERELGAGGMATVYLARDVKHDRQVALKVLRPELSAVLGGERFLNEIRITANLQHPHILTLIDSGVADGLLYYVLPYVRGESLRDRLGREQQLGLEEALAIARQVAGALDYAHRQGVVHRDIKPENILLHEGEAMLADFGIALAVKEAGGNRLTETGLSLGTPQYMSPEQATGDRQLDARSDVYSLGAVLYEMLAGEPPVTGPTVQAVVAKLLTERPTRLRVVRDTVPEGVDAAVAKALAKVPADRFANAGDFAAALKAPDAASGTAPRTSGRRVVVVMGVVVVAAAAAILGYRMTRPARGAAVVLDRVQLTFTGNANVASLSPDGQRVAYATRSCDPRGRCTYDIVVQDVGGAGSATVARGFGAVWRSQWTRDGRWLVLHASLGSGRWGLFSVPSLGGGTPRYLGCCAGDLVGGDTVVVSRGGGGADSLLWIRRATVADGVVHDSVGIRWPAATGFVVRAFPDGRRLLLGVQERGRQLFAVADRDGDILDSVLAGPGDLDVVAYPIADAVLAAWERPGRGDEATLLRYRVDGAGRIERRPDTLVARLPVLGSLTFAADSSAVVADGATAYSLWTLRRASASSMRFELRPLATGTAPLSGAIAPAGDRVFVIRTVSGEGRQRRQLSVMPADSGPETPLGAPIVDLVDWDASPDGRVLFTGALRDSATVVVQAWDLASGRPREVGVFRRAEYGGLEGLPGGGIILVEQTGRRVRIVGAPGRADTAFDFDERIGRVSYMDPSPDGRHFATIGWDFQDDSILVHRVDLATGRAARLAAFSGEGWDAVRWLPGDVLQFGIMETAGTLAWYALPANGGRAVRLGVPPRYPASYRLSGDGLRVLVRARDPRTDVYVIRNFRELLAR